ncbi:MAG: SCO family protein [Bacteroidetes bacterium HGW-Bacteroidetes-17]|jgi:protein SCO1/2|nr:MAG: SCO family protein [Bacteroidetes bacterium HGW-Bacteroidetes-17]
MKIKKSFRILTFFLLILSFSKLHSQELGLYEKLNDFLPPNISLIDENGNTVLLQNIIDKPTVISFVYYECPGLCSPLLEGVAQVISRTSLDLGTEYQVLTISFDPSEGTELAVGKKASYSKLVDNKDVKNGWKYFTADQENIDKLLNSFGYKIKKEGEEFIHPAAIMVVSPEGKITRYLHGTYFLPFDLKMAVVEAQEGKSGPTINKVLQFCFSYDAEGKKYVFNVTKISGSIILLLALILFGTLVIRNKKNKTQKA